MDLEEWIKRKQVYLTAANSVAILILMAAGVIVSILVAKGAFKSTAPAKIELMSVAESFWDKSLQVAIRNSGGEGTQIMGIDTIVRVVMTRCDDQTADHCIDAVSLPFYFQYQFPEEYHERFPTVPAYSTKVFELHTRFPPDDPFFRVDGWSVGRGPSEIRCEGAAYPISLLLRFASGQILVVPIPESSLPEPPPPTPGPCERWGDAPRQASAPCSEG